MLASACPPCWPVSDIPPMRRFIPPPYPLWTAMDTVAHVAHVCETPKPGGREKKKGTFRGFFQPCGHEYDPQDKRNCLALIGGVGLDWCCHACLLSHLLGHALACTVRWRYKPKVLPGTTCHAGSLKPSVRGVARRYRWFALVCSLHCSKPTTGRGVDLERVVSFKSCTPTDTLVYTP